MVLKAKDLMRVLDTVHAMNAAPDGALERTLLTAASELVACDTVSYNEHRPKLGQELRVWAEPSYVERSPIRRHYLRHLSQHPPVLACATGRLASGECVAVSDLASGQQFRALPIYADYFRHRG